ncbi:hypothetical protein [Kribbella sp. NPDC048928]|uniref:hypothetical protein n=1 Tax=Kribbella sp. NPDC048928 TaxID=3364111 RepID=UPI0037160A38
MTGADSLAWKFATIVSARTHVRVAIADVTGNYQNSYPTLAPIDGPEPHGPYAVQLGSRSGDSFAVLGFDLDANRGDVTRDLDVLLGLLDSAGISYLVAESGPSGGRHVWVRPTSPAPAGLIKQLAHGLRYQLPTLDITPLTNPATGALRPPGAPHRSGGRSKLLDGDLNTFLTATATSEQLEALTQTIATALPPVSRDATVRMVACDAAGHPHLPGPKRPLPQGSRQALQQVVEGPVDGNGVLWSILLGAARAHWTLADVRTLLTTRAPGLEHLRTTVLKTPGSTTRIPRTDGETEAVLTRQWARAVAHIEAAGTGSNNDDGEFVERAAALASGIEAAQHRADAAPGRWSQSGGATDRLVFDQLCILHLQAVAPAVEADQRRLAMLCGLGRETVRRALERLSHDGWINQTATATGPKAAAWAVAIPCVAEAPSSDSVDGRDSVSTDNQIPQAQADPRPPHLALTLRTELLARLQSHIALQAHDVFTPQGLGHDAGAIWAQLAEGTDLAELTAKTGYAEPRVTRQVHELHELGMWHWDPNLGTAATEPDRRDEVAGLLGVRGVLAERERSYHFERELWSWWLEHVDWLKTPGKDKRRILSQRWRRRQDPAQLVIAVPGLTRTHKYGPYPRRAGRGAHTLARQVIAAAETAAATVVAAETSRAA